MAKHVTRHHVRRGTRDIPAGHVVTDFSADELAVLKKVGAVRDFNEKDDSTLQVVPTEKALAEAAASKPDDGGDTRIAKAS